jgi:hypothetical protein
MFKNKNLFFRAGFIILSVLFFSWYISLLMSISNGSWGSLLTRLFFIFIYTEILKKVYIRKFSEDFITKYGFLSLFIFSTVILTIDNFTKEKDIKKNNISLKNKINAMLDTCNYYEAKLYEKDVLFKHKNDNYNYLISEGKKPYTTFKLLKYNPKYDYLVSSFIKCPKDSSKLVYIFDEQGILSVILKLKNSNDAQLKALKDCLNEFQ